MAKILLDGVVVDRELPAPQPKTEDEIRSERNFLLAKTDWTSASDLTMSSDMTAYRQALRDVPTQAGFPTSITWPTKP